MVPFLGGHPVYWDLEYRSWLSCTSTVEKALSIIITSIRYMYCQ